MVSLNYLPTAERLILVVAKAQNLCWPSPKPVGGLYQDFSEDFLVLMFDQ